MTLTNRTHGKAGTYTAGCRCAECRNAWRLYSRSNTKRDMYRRAETLAGKWLREHHPDSWAELLDTVEQGYRR